MPLGGGGGGSGGVPFEGFVQLYCFVFVSSLLFLNSKFSFLFSHFLLMKRVGACAPFPLDQLLPLFTWVVGEGNYPRLIRIVLYMIYLAISGLATTRIA